LDAGSSYKVITPTLKLNPNENHLTIFQVPTISIDSTSGAIASFNTDNLQKNIKLKVNKISINTDSNQFMIEKLI